LEEEAEKDDDDEEEEEVAVVVVVVTGSHTGFALFTRDRDLSIIRPTTQIRVSLCRRSSVTNTVLRPLLLSKEDWGGSGGGGEEVGKDSGRGTQSQKVPSIVTL
jgi:hypothetical protein